MKGKPRAIVILSILFGYVLLQFIWWEVLLVKQTGTITEEKQRLIELSSSGKGYQRTSPEKKHAHHHDRW